EPRNHRLKPVAEPRSRLKPASRRSTRTNSSNLIRRKRQTRGQLRAAVHFSSEGAHHFGSGRDFADNPRRASASARKAFSSSTASRGSPVGLCPLTAPS